MSKKYFEVICKCGHVKRSKYIPISFGVIAENGKEAARKARYFKRVKHDHKDCILKVTEISFERYVEIFEMNENDPYLHCKNIQEQKQIDLDYRLLEDTHSKKNNYIKNDYTSVVYKKEVIKKPKKYFNCIYDYRTKEVY